MPSCTTRQVATTTVCRLPHLLDMLMAHRAQVLRCQACLQHRLAPGAQVVGIYLDRGWLYIVACTAVLLAG